MKLKIISILITLLITMISCKEKPEGKHVFILSGQSNMVGLKVEESFLPALESEFGPENIVLIKDAAGGQPIRRWVKNWKPLKGDEPKVAADLYDSLMKKVRPAMDTIKIASITFLWMQGERDAREAHGEVYKESLMALYTQLQQDLKYPDINFVIGRLSDFDMDNKRYPHWTMIRDAHQRLGESNARFSWVDTDDLNDGLNRNGKEIKDDLHMSAKGYIIMGERFAQKSIELIQKNQ